MAAFDFNEDGWADFVVTRNKTASLAFRNSGRADRNPLAVTLQGAAGNRTAIGARVELVLHDGSSQVAEVAAGSGYMSQSSATCFFGYFDSNVPREVKVTWPDGSITTHATVLEGGKMLIRRP